MARCTGVGMQAEQFVKTALIIGALSLACGLSLGSLSLPGQEGRVASAGSAAAGSAVNTAAVTSLSARVGGPASMQKTSGQGRRFPLVTGSN